MNNTLALNYIKVPMLFLKDRMVSLQDIGVTIILILIGETI